MESEDLYKVLQVDPDAEPEIIDAAYRRLARKYHPDVNSAPEATARLQRISAAFEILVDPEQRAAYDHARRARTSSTVNPIEAVKQPGQRAGVRVSVLGGLLDLGFAFGRRSPRD
jgi:curved DNA-binding protein CbpA